MLTAIEGVMRFVRREEESWALGKCLFREAGINACK